MLRVIIDGIDGTGNFTRGIPFFCSAAAILLGTQPRVSAVYDPLHHTVYSGVLQGPVNNPSEESDAWAWQVAAGNRFNLVQLAETSRQHMKGQKDAIAIHLTRSHPDKLREFISNSSSESILQRLTKIAGTIYALNSGILAMTEVARGALGGLVNNITNPWDIAAGEVLVHACGGRVTDFENKPICYSVENYPSLLAAREDLHTRILEEIRV